MNSNEFIIDMSKNDKIKGYISILIKSIEIRKIYKIKRNLPEMSDSISLSVSKNLTKLLSLSFNSSSSLCLSLSPLFWNLPCQKELKLLLPYVNILILLKTEYDSPSSLENKWLKDIILESEQFLDLKKIEIEPKLFDYWKSILRVEKLRNKQIQVWVRKWHLTSCDSLKELMNDSSSFDFWIKDWMLVEEMNIIGDLYMRKLYLNKKVKANLNLLFVSPIQDLELLSIWLWLIY